MSYTSLQMEQMRYSKYRYDKIRKIWLAEHYAIDCAEVTMETIQIC